jgi:hypothetical protein
LYSSPNTIRVIKPSMIISARYPARMGVNRPLGRPTVDWKTALKQVLQKSDRNEEWILLTQEGQVNYMMNVWFH